MVVSKCMFPRTASPIFHKRSHDDMFGASPLMGGNHVFVPGDLSHNIPETVEALAASISFIPTHEGSPLRIAHCRRSAVGEEVDVYIFASEAEDVVPCLLIFRVLSSLVVILIGSTILIRYGSAYYRHAVAWQITSQLGDIRHCILSSFIANM
jgi:hypothetical protein